MLPLITEGDAIRVKPLLQAQDLRIGDIVLFKGASGMIAHRVVGKFEKDGSLYFKEKGDQGFFPTAIHEGCIIGKIVTIYKPNTTINTTNYFWSCTNFTLGCYWWFLFSFLGIFPTIQAKLLGSNKLPFIHAAYRKVSQFLIKFPTTIFRHK